MSSKTSEALVPPAPWNRGRFTMCKWGSIPSCTVFLLHIHILFTYSVDYVCISYVCISIKCVYVSTVLCMYYVCMYYVYAMCGFFPLHCETNVYICCIYIYTYYMLWICYACIYIHVYYSIYIYMCVNISYVQYILWTCISIYMQYVLSYAHIICVHFIWYVSTMYIMQYIYIIYKHCFYSWFMCNWKGKNHTCLIIKTTPSGDRTALQKSGLGDRPEGLRNSNEHLAANHATASPTQGASACKPTSCGLHSQRCSRRDATCLHGWCEKDLESRPVGEDQQQQQQQGVVCILQVLSNGSQKQTNKIHAKNQQSLVIYTQ